MVVAMAAAAGLVVVVVVAEVLTGRQQLEAAKVASLPCQSELQQQQQDDRAADLHLRRWQQQ